MDRDSYDERRWQQWLIEQECSDVELAKFQLMDEYMATRENMPSKTVDGNDMALEPKTTIEIVRDLRPMAEVGTDAVVVWMKLHSFHTTTLDDGTLAWAIWRDMRPLM